MSYTLPSNMIKTSDGRIVRKRGGAWVTRWAAERALTKAGLASNLLIDGVGHDEAYVRSYWLRERCTAGVYDYFDSDESWPINDEYRFTLEVHTDSRFPNVVSNLKDIAAHLRMIAPDWNARVKIDCDTVLLGFTSRDDLSFFLSKHTHWHDRRLGERPSEFRYAALFAAGLKAADEREVCSTTNSTRASSVAPPAQRRCLDPKEDQLALFA